VFPGQNGLITYRGYTGASWAIYVVNSDGTDQRVVKTITDPSDGNPAFSPDGSQIAFAEAVGGSFQNIYVMDTDGSNVQQASFGDRMEWGPAWSPDGSKLAYAQSDGSVIELWVTDLATNVATAITETEIAYGGSNISWSPDGQTIAFAGGDGLLRLIDADGSNERVLVGYGIGVFIESPDWSPDGTRIVFEKSGGTSDIHIYDLISDADTMLTDTLAEPSWSPDGTKIVARAGLITVVDVATGAKTLLAGVTGEDPDWGLAPLLEVEFTQAIQQLQSLSDLREDLKGDGKPPVPIIADKPAVMRVYFDEVDQPGTYDVSVTGMVSGSETVTLTPACDIERRRKLENNCESVDFYFTPPEGNWSVSLKIKDQGGATLFEQDFQLTSDKTDDLLIRGVSVCDTRTPGLLGQWQCQDPFPLMSMVSLMRRMLPTSSVSVLMTGQHVRREAASFAQPIDWWSQVDRDLQAMYGFSDWVADQLLDQETYYFGLARTSVPGRILGAAYRNTRGAASLASYANRGYEAIPWVVAHEMGHAMGRDHTNTDAPADDGTKGCWLGTGTQVPPWPWADNTLRSGPNPEDIEVGFDVASGTVLPGDEHFEMMGYCASPPPSVSTSDIVSWISPFTTNQLLEPPGPLAAFSVHAGPASTALADDFWLVRGTLEHGSGEVALEPLLRFQMEGSAEPGSGTHRIEVQDGSGAALFTRFFTPAHGHGSPSPGEPVLETDDAFSELIPTHADAASIAIIDGQDTEIGEITLDGAAPSVSINLPASFTGVQAVSWDTVDPDSTAHTFWVDYSPDNGETWQNQAMGLEDDSLVLDFDEIAGSDNALFRVIASDGVNSGQAVSTSFAVAGKPPDGEIIAPSGSAYRQGHLVWLQAAAWDIDDGTLDGSAVTWSSSADGALGTGASLPVYDLSVGTHTITMTVRDSDDNVVTDTIEITVFDGPIVEGDITHGDVNCSGGPDAEDALVLLWHLAGAGTAPCLPIGAGEPKFGDANCDLTVDVEDVIVALQFVADLAADIPTICRPYGF
jgi:hypothetical protein